MNWFDLHGRHGLPWQSPRSPYRVWVSEIMLQQTQVSTVIPYFERFVSRFPDVIALADASQDAVLSLWAGLGYYARGRNLHRAAQMIRDKYQGDFPTSIESLVELPGIGRSTAGAILSQAMDEPHAILDGNVRRVIARHRLIEQWPGDPRLQERMWQYAEDWLPEYRAADYTQAIMDLGSLVCTRSNPSCGECPVHEDCEAFLRNRTRDVPLPRPRRDRPLRKRPIAVVLNATGAVLVQRRPPVGIWGGLWCLPMGEDDEAPELLCERIGARITQTKPAPPIRHALTHFELQLQPVQARLDASTLLRDTAQEQWLNLREEASWPGLPAPVRALLQQMRQHETDLLAVNTESS